MRKLRTALAVLAIILISVTGALIFWGMPRVVEVYPEQGSDPVQAGTPLQVSFSRSMQAASVADKLSIDPPISGDFNWEGNTLIFTPDQAWPSGQTVRVLLEAGARAEGILPLVTRQDTRWEFTIGHPLLVYLYPSNAPADLYLLDPQNGNIQQLSDAPGAVLDYSLSPQGTAIFYNAHQGDGGSSLYRVERASGTEQLLLECPDALCRYPVVSPDGAYLAYERTALASSGQVDMPQVWLLPLAAAESGTQVMVGEPIMAAPADHKTQQPQWSPDGLLTYYDYDRSEFVVQDVQGRQVVAFPSQTGFPGTWHPSGDDYVIPEIYTSPIADSASTDLEDIPTSRLLRYNLDGSMLDLTAVNNVEDSSPSYSPNGDMLAFGRKYLDLQRWTPGRQIWLMQSDGSQATSITNDPYYNHYDLTWSPDGSQLAFVRFNKNSLIDPPELWLMQADGFGATRLITGGYAPQWIP
jgi:hypothetical protein